MSSIPPLAQGDGLFGLPAVVVIIIVLVLVVFIGFLLLVMKYYKRCPSNRMLVIYGLTKRSEAAVCVAGGARFVDQFLEDPPVLFGFAQQAGVGMAQPRIDPIDCLVQGKRFGKHLGTGCKPEEP